MFFARSARFHTILRIVSYTIAKRCVHALFYALACDFAKLRMEKSKDFANVIMEDSSDFAFTRMEECCDFGSYENGRKLFFRISQNSEKWKESWDFASAKITA